jgi:hypothetical protein
MFRKLGWLAAACWVVACSGATTEEPVLNKAKVAQGDVETNGDACAEQKWYGDGECDTFCEKKDTDCVAVPGEPVLCAAFIEESDGKCSRPEDDYCRMQDPDCKVTTTEPDDGVACALYVEKSDGKCSRSEEDPCKSQDPDCIQTGCPAIAMLPDGKCEERPDDVCWSDPDCQVSCDAYIEDSDGACTRKLDDPCIRQDPDCDFSVCAAVDPMIDGVCHYDSEFWICDPDCKEPPVCATLLPVKMDGKCDMTNDPCWGSDPDCTSCAPQDAKGDGLCKMLLGVAWNGKECISLGGCSCIGEDCENLYADMDVCAKAHLACGGSTDPQPGSCEPQEAKGIGMCEMFMGYKWTGKTCEGVSGCSCEGADCKALTMDADVCKKEHEACL